MLNYLKKKDGIFEADGYADFQKRKKITSARRMGVVV
jgi:hypothetical protein